MFQICQVNISGLSKHSHIALDKYSHQLGNDVLVIQETLVKPKDDSSQNPKFTNLDSFYLKNDRGVSTHIKSTLLPQRITQLEDNFTDAIWTCFTFNSTLTLIGNVYSNPNMPSNNIHATLNNIANGLEYAKKYKIKNVIILGDFNCRHRKWSDLVSNKNGEILDKYMSDNTLSCLSPNAYTFSQSNGGSVIDLAFVSADVSKIYHSSSVDQNIELFSGAPQKGHFPAVHQFKTTNIQPKKGDTTLIYKDLKNTDWSKWTSVLNSKLHQANLLNSTDARCLWENMRKLITDTNDEVMPVKKITEHSKPFWNSKLTDLSHIVRRAKDAMSKRSTPSNINRYKEAKYNFSSELIKAKNCWIKSELEHLNVVDSKIFWAKYKKSIVGDSREGLGNLEEGGVIHTDTGEKENILFNTFFTGSHMDNASFDSAFEDKINKLYSDVISEGQESSSKITLNSEISSTTIDDDPLNDDISLEEIYAAIKHQKSTVRSFDSDNIHPIMLKHLPTIAISILCKMFNLVLSEYHWVWDVSHVVFIRKDGKPNYLKAVAYRPISISSYIGKIMERIIERRIRVHCKLEDILDDEQEGFRSSRNTTRYLYKLVANLKESQRKNFTSFLLCIDFEKAFDSVWLKGLIVKLYNWNIRGKILLLINSFLQNRKVKLIVNKTLGAARTCGRFGLPQGSVLSPLLFIMFISDMFDLHNSGINISTLCKEHSTVYKYADDGSVLIMHKDPKICNILAQELCDHISHWCFLWKLIVNCDQNKTECLVIKPKKRNNFNWTDLVELKISGKTVRFEKSTKILGLNIDDKLEFDLHAGKTLSRCWFTWHKITRYTNRHFGLNISSMVILFKSVVLTKLLYASPVWLDKNNIGRFKDFYARVCLKISGATHYAPQGITLLAVGVEPLSLLYKVICIKFVLKALSSDDNMKGLIYQIEGSRSHPFYNHILLTKNYLSMKSEFIVNQRQYYQHCSLLMLYQSQVFYNKSDIMKLKLRYWNDYFSSEADLKSRKLMNAEMLDDNQCYIYSNDNTLVESTLLHKTLFPRYSKRSTDTKVMSLLHGHDLSFRSFKYAIGKISNPNCEICVEEKDDNIHQLLLCPRFNCHYRNLLKGLSTAPSIAQGILSQHNLTHLEGLRKMAQIIFH